MINIASLSLLLFVLPWIGIAQATPCGKWYSSACVADTDIRYDSDYTSALTELSPLWNQLEGYWINDVGFMMNPLLGQVVSGETHHYPDRGIDTQNLPYPLTGGKAFYNETFDGSRYHSNRYYMFPPASPSFCKQPIPSGATNVIGNGICGVNGFSAPAGIFGTAGYEKEGTITTLKGMGLYSNLERDIQGFSSPVDDVTFVSTNLVEDLHRSSQTNVFLKNYTQMSAAQLTFSLRSKFGPILTNMQSYTLRKVTKEQWFFELKEAYQKFNISQEDRIQGGTLPMQTSCIIPEECPTQDEWCTQDPSCSVSPYQEPEATVKAGPIVGIVLGVVVVLFILGYAYYRYRLRRQAKRYREKFAGRVAETIDLRASMTALTPEGLAKEFERIESETKDGYISKSELWIFISEGKAGVIDEAEFSALFAALDSDGNGKVDFLEFCSFLSVCGQEFETAKQKRLEDMKHNNKSGGAIRSSISRRLSSMSSRDFGVIVEEEDEIGNDKMEEKRTEDDSDST